MSKPVRTIVVIALILAACSPSGAGTTTTTSQTAATTTSSDTTQSQAATTTTTVAAATTTTTATTVDADAIVLKKTAAVEAAVPEGWNTATGPATTDQQSDDVVYEACLLPDDLDIDNLDDFTSAALLTSFDGPDANPPFPPPRGSIEARVFESEDVAADAFAVFERVFGSAEGLDCMTESVVDLMGDDDLPGELIFTTEQVTVAGSQAGARFEMSFDVSGFAGAVYVEFQGARMGDCTVIASFITFGEPLDREVADALFEAAINA